MTETQVGELLERATADLRPPTDLVAGGIAAGRRRRRRGLVLTAAGTFAAAALGGTAVLVSVGGSGDDDAVVADHPSAGTTLVSPPVVPDPSADVVLPYDGPFPLPPQAMASTLATLVHGRVTDPSDEQHHLAAADGWQSGAVDLDGASVSVSYQHSTGPRCDGDLARGNTDCTALGGGYFLSHYSAELTTTGEGRTGARDIGVTYYTPDGYKINATASNAGSADPAHPSMDQPVLDLDALTAIAQDDVWR